MNDCSCFRSIIDIKVCSKNNLFTKYILLKKYIVNLNLYIKFFHNHNVYIFNNMLFFLLISNTQVIGDEIYAAKYFMDEIQSNININQLCIQDKHLIKISLKEYPTSLRGRDQGGEPALDPEIAWLAKANLVDNISKCSIMDTNLIIYFGDNRRLRRHIFPRSKSSMNREYYVIIEKNRNNNWEATPFPANKIEYDKWINPDQK